MAKKKTQPQLPTKENPVITFYQKDGERIERVTFTGKWDQIDRDRLKSELEYLKTAEITNKEKIKELEKILQ